MNMNSPEIRFVEHADIDYKKWDQCVANSPFGMVYAKSWYLDRICGNWDALIGDDYLYVMPIPNNRKFGIRYIFQPFFTQQLGVFSGIFLTSEIVDRFLNAIPGQFKLTDQNLNLGNQPKTPNFSFRQNTTYHLSLVPEVAGIRKAYKTNTRRNIQKAIQQNILIKPVGDVGRFLRFTFENLELKSSALKRKHYSALEQVILFALTNQSGELLGAWDGEDNLLASVFFVKANQTVIYLAASSSKSGTEKKAMFLLVDTFIRKNAGKNLTLDFEGSNIPGVARFYAGFGAIPQTYYSVHQNRLPKLLRIFKK